MPAAGVDQINPTAAIAHIKLAAPPVAGRRNRNIENRTTAVQPLFRRIGFTVSPQDKKSRRGSTAAAFFRAKLAPRRFCDREENFRPWQTWQRPTLPSLET
jgi:hypothetical protein